MKKTPPYDTLALIYDKLMSHVNYKIWAEYVVNLFQYSKIKINTILDVSCGTGSLLKKLNNQKYKLFGSDVTQSMVLKAREKFDKTIFTVSDVKQLGFKSAKFDAVLFLYDSLNYMQNIKELNQSFGEISRVLKKDGIFIFDVITDLLCKTHYRNFEEEENWNDWGYLRHSYYDEKDKIQHNDFRIKIKGQILFENHVQKVFSDREIYSNLKQNQFEIMAKLDDFTFHPSSEDSERIHYVCLKK